MNIFDEAYNGLHEMQPIRIMNKAPTTSLSFRCNGYGAELSTE
jgi:hypothetical protein